MDNDGSTDINKVIAERDNAIKALAEARADSAALIKAFESELQSIQMKSVAGIKHLSQKEVERAKIEHDAVVHVYRKIWKNKESAKALLAHHREQIEVLEARIKISKRQLIDILDIAFQLRRVPGMIRDYIQTTMPRGEAREALEKMTEPVAAFNHLDFEKLRKELEASHDLPDLQQR